MRLFAPFEHDDKMVGTIIVPAAAEAVFFRKSLLLVGIDFIMI